MGLFVVAVEKNGVVAVLVGEAAEGVVAGSVVACATGKRARGVFFVCALGAAIDVEPDHGVALVDELLRDVERGEVVVAGCVVELPEDCGDLVVGGVVGGDEGDGVVGGVEDLEGWWGYGGTWWVGGVCDDRC